MQKPRDRKLAEKEALFWNGIKKTLGKDIGKKCLK